MRPFELEIFDRQFNYRAHALIGADEFQWQQDMLSGVNNTIKLYGTDIVIRENPASGSTGDGTVAISDYVRIITNTYSFSGVVKKLEKEDDTLIITYTDFTSLFNHEVFTDPLEVTNSTIENYIAKLLTLSFISNSDTSQRIPGLTITVVTATVGVFDFVDPSKKMAVINILNDLIYPAFKKYLVGLYVHFDVGNKNINVEIRRKATNIIKTIESDLPNVMDKNVLIRGTSTEINKLTIIDDDEEHDFPKYNYYLHTDYTYDTNGSTNRLLPVINDMELVDMNTLAEAGYWTANAGVLYAADLIELDRTLTNSEVSNISSGMSLLASYIYSARGTGKENFDYIGTSTNVHTAYWELNEQLVSSALDRFGNHYQWFANESPDNNIYDDIQELGEGYYWFIAEVLTGSSHREYSAQANKGNYDGHYHITINGTIPTTPGDHRSNPISCSGWVDCGSHDLIKQDVKITLYATLFGNGGTPSVYEFQFVTYSKVDREEYEAALDTYKQTVTYKNNVAAYKSSHLSDILSDYAGSVFGTSKFKNLIELTVKQNDSLVEPMTIPFGRHLNIIHKGMSYHSILTGITVLPNGLSKLTFGMIRLELTKLLNMKGV